MQSDDDFRATMIFKIRARNFFIGRKSNKKICTHVVRSFAGAVVKSRAEKSSRANPISGLQFPAAGAASVRYREI
jgi:hypothetical protein